MVFLAKKKIFGVFSALSVFVILMTINHYVYLQPHNEIDSFSSGIEEEFFKPGEVVIKPGQKIEEPKPDMTVLEEINRNLKSKRIEFVKKLEAKKAQNAVKRISSISGDEILKRRAIKKSSEVVGDDFDVPVLNKDGTRYIPRRRVVHFDLKGAPPKVDYLKSLFPLIRAAGATNILLEYEDMFPYWGPIRNISARNAYSKAEIKDILSAAEQSDLEVIPLVQTFGHLEFALKLREFENLREDPYSPQALCPSQNQSWTLVKMIIDQVMELHPKSKWLHIGCDEVFQLAQCPICQETLHKLNNKPSNKVFHDSRTLFLDHLHRVASYVKQDKKTIPIAWDDMMRHIPEELLIQADVGSLVEPMVWVYIEDVDRFVDPLVWSTYSKVFAHVWTSSAYKGAFGEMLYATNIERHVGNNLAWLEVMMRESQGSNSINFRGISLAGWSRYDHFAVLCELLPASVPSLILSLNVLKEGAHTPKAALETNRQLDCGNSKSLMTQEELMHSSEQWDLQRCEFSGAEVIALLNSYDMTKKEVETVYDKVMANGWLTDYHVAHKFASIPRVNEGMKNVAFLPSSLRALRKQVTEGLSKFYDQYTVSEWLEQHLLPLEKMVHSLEERLKMLTSKTNWPRRPLESVSAP